MDSLRKWLNKPKADDKSLLARFYHADRALTAVASELDSFDGRAEPVRCTRLVGRLRQGQDRVLAITNQIMDELLGEDRAPRAFRAKFPEEVLQESLAGQLWFGAECLAAGSSIMNRELESATMRPLAKAVTKSLENVRALLREQCLRNNTPNSLTLQLDVNDAATEQLYESLKIFDRLFAEFELLYVSAMVQVKSKQEYEIQELICVLFSETLQRALKIGLLDQEQVDSYDPALMFSIPRLAIVAGLVIFKDGPLNMDQPADNISEMFRPFRKLLIKMRDLLLSLTKHELYQLEKLLCTNEEISLKEQLICDENENDTSGTSQQDGEVVIVTTNASANVNSSDNNSHNQDDQTPHDGPRRDSVSAGDNRGSSFFNNRTIDSNVNEDDDVSENDDDEDDPSSILKDGLVTSDCASGYLIPNTNFGNLLQTNEAPLTDSFIATDDELTLGEPSNARIQQILSETNQKLVDSGLGTANPSVDHSPELETERPVTNADISESSEEEGEVDEYERHEDEDGEDEDGEDSESTLCDTYRTSLTVDPSTSTGLTKGSERQTRKQIQHQHSRRHRRSSTAGNGSVATSRKHYSKHRTSSAGTSASTGGQQQESSKSNNRTWPSYSSCDTSPLSDNQSESGNSSSGSTSSSSSSGNSTTGDAPQEVVMAIRTAGRIKFKTTENLLHRLFVCIAGVADQLQTNFAADIRQMLKSVFIINSSPPEPEEPPETVVPSSSKPKEPDPTDLFEFRASEQDVITPGQNSGGSSQSIYSAEEANPEDPHDSVFASPGTSPVRASSAPRMMMTTAESGGVTVNVSVSVVTGGNSSSNRGSQERSVSLSEASIVVEGSGGGGSVSTGGGNNGSNLRENHRRHSAIGSKGEYGRSRSSPSSPVNVGSLPEERRMPEAPPRWIPDGDAPRCMACATSFTPFRRRHHCRNCGGVFCRVCSSASVPLLKYGLTKAVRVCRDCYIREVGV